MGYLQNIDRPGSGSRMGGILTIDVIRKSDVESIPDAVDGIVSGPAVLKAGKSFVRWTAGYQSAGISSTTQQSREGANKTNTLPFVLPLDRPGIRRMLELAEEDEFIVIYRYATGATKIFGTLDAPVRFEFNHESGQSPTDGNANNCRFFYSGPDNTYFYDAAAPGPTPGAAPAIVRVNGVVVASLQPGESINFDTDFEFDFAIVGT